MDRGDHMRNVVVHGPGDARVREHEDPQNVEATAAVVREFAERADAAAGAGAG